MAEKQHLGIFWGTDCLYCAHTVGSAIKDVFTVAFTHEDAGNVNDGQLVPEGMQIHAKIQEALSERNIQGIEINLALPTKDIIFRSFVIPWMQGAEIKNAVEFEASKYIPFALDELVYSYHHMTTTENDTRRIRVIFVAIKKDALENYTTTLEQAGYQASVIEPGPLSIIRLLKHKESLPADETIAIIEKTATAGKLIIVHNHIPQFVREFQLKSLPLGEEDTEEDPAEALNRLMNEIRISLNYFNRQDSSLEVNKILLLDSLGDPELATQMSDDLSIPTTLLKPTELLDNPEAHDIEYASAFGAVLIDDVQSPAQFFFSKKKSEGMKKPSLANIKKSIDYKSVAITGAACLGLGFAIFALTNRVVVGPKEKVETLKSQLGTYQDVSTDMLKKKNADISKKLNSFRSIRISSDVALLINTIPNLLPEGTWINNLDVYYQEKSTLDPGEEAPENPTMDVIGYAYRENTKEQFSTVNDFLRNIKREKIFTEHFKDIDLETVNVEKIGDYSVTAFKIKCQ